MINSVRFSAVYRLVENSQPVTDEAKARNAFGRFQAKNNNEGYFFAQKDDTKGGAVQNCVIVTPPDRQDFVKKAGQLIALGIKAIFSSKAEKQFEQLETQLWQDTLAKATDLDINTL
jgi:hypothetical protein